jgi:vitamin B12 transporter
MSSRSLRLLRRLAFTFTFTLASVAFAANGISGHILDPLGAHVANAKVVLISGGKEVSSTASDSDGGFSFTNIASSRYTIRASAAGFASAESSPVMVHADGEASVDLTLPLGAIAQQIVVTATGTDIPESQVGASVNVIDEKDLAGRLAAFDSLRIASGIQGVQTGGLGGKASLFVRGANSTSNKVIIDGVPADDIGGTYEFANLGASSLGSVEIFRGPNSVLFGSDAIGSVVNVTTRRGITATPQLELTAEGGTFGTYDYSANLSGAYRAFDYLSELARVDSRNNIPNDSYHNVTFTGNYGWSPLASTELRVNVRRNVSNVGQPNEFDAFKIADDSYLKEQNTFISATLQNQTAARWHNLIRYGAARISLQSVNPTLSGIPFDPFGFGANGIGQPVTLCALAGCATGQAILDFAGTYPSYFDSLTSRDFLQTQSDYHFSSHLTALFGFRYENERGITNSAFSSSSTSRDNFSYTLQAQGDLFRRIYATAGVGLEKNAIFGFAGTPKVSLAYYLARPSDGTFSGTKLRFNFGKGIKEPSIFNETSSLFNILTQSAPQLISQFHLSPTGPERSRSFDFGFEQGFFGRHVLLSQTFFHNVFYDQLEFVDKTLLPGLGVPAAAAAALPFGAAVNSLDYHARGAETELRLDLSHGLSATATYTYTAAVVTKSFSSDNQFPSFNPAFPNIPIGGFSPLVGNRPFRIAPHVGSFGIVYVHQKLFASLTGYLSGRRDDSTFLTDSFFGTSLLLPNRNLDPAYQKLDLHAAYNISRAVQIFGTAENLLNQRYDAAYGFPSLPFTVRAGMKFTIGGEGWKPKSQ